jgi:hypothetical protein
MTKRKITEQTMIYKTLTANYILRNLKTEQYEPHLKPLVNAGAPEVVAVPTPLMTPIVLLKIPKG